MLILASGVFFMRDLQEVDMKEDGGVLSEIGDLLPLPKLASYQSIPATVEVLQSKTFQHCECLTVITFQNGLKFVDDHVFHAWMVDSLSSWKSALESWKRDLSDGVNAIVGANEVAPRQSLLDEAILVLSHY